MFRRFRYKDEDGHWQRKWKKRVRDEQGRVRFIDYDRDAYRTGPGVYKSAYKNAMRLARTETNIAYHTADHTRWQQLDFVIGYDVVLTNNPGHVEDICDELAGRYPKTFKFVGWHPHCRCRALPVLKSEQDMQADNERIMQGKRPKPAEPLPTPECFTKWVEANAERISKATTLPYFIRDNKAVVERITGKQINEPKPTAITPAKRTPQQIAEARHKARTETQVNGIKVAARIREMRGLNLTDSERKAIALHTIEIEKALGIKKGARMPIEKADKQSANPKHVEKFIPDPNGLYIDRDGGGKRYSLNPAYVERRDKPFNVNCQTCAPTYALRLIGFDITAKGNTLGSLSNYISNGHSFDIWMNADKTPAVPTLYKVWAKSKGYVRMNANRYKEFFYDNCKDTGVYVVTVAWKGRGAHATIIQRFEDGHISYIEPQVYNGTCAERDIMEICKNGSTAKLYNRGVMRIDNKLFDLKYISIFDKVTK